MQSDVYLIRLLRAGGPELISREHPDRPVYGLLLAETARLAGEQQTIYIAIALVGWAILAGEAVWLWRLLFPQWPEASPVVALALLAPIANRVQFTTLTTTIPCVIPVMLVLAALLLLLRRPEAEAGYGRRIAALVLVATAALVSEYALAATLAASALAFVLGRRRSIVWLASGLLVGYAGFRSVSNVALRQMTDPDIQLERLFAQPWYAPFRLFAGAWSSIVGGWGRAASEVRWDWGSKTTILAAFAGLLVAAITAPLISQRTTSDPLSPTVRPLLALSAAVVVGFIPVAITGGGWPPPGNYATRFQLPILVFASCLTVAIVMGMTRRSWRTAALGALIFVAADQLVVRAVELRRLQPELERVGKRLLPIVQRADGVVVLVVSDRSGLLAREMLKVADSWPPNDAKRLWVELDGAAASIYGSRSGCRNPNSIVVPRELRWVLSPGRVAEILWESSIPGAEPFEPYFLGCSVR